MMYILRKEFVVLWKHCEVSKFLKEVSNIEVERSYYSSRMFVNVEMVCIALYLISFAVWIFILSFIY